LYLSAKMSLRINVLVIGCLLLSLKGLAQNAGAGLSESPFHHYFEDTLRPGYRISGSFDSIDRKIAEYQATLPTSFRPATELFNPERMYTEAHHYAPLRFSAITHVGLYYSIGSNNSQKAGVAYTQSLTENQFIQMNYERISSNGALRRSSLESNHFDVSHLFRRNRYASQVSLLFDGSDRALNGGLLNDSLDEAFALIFQDVTKPEALLNKRYFRADWRNFISFTADSLIKTGIYLAPHLQTETRRYTERPAELFPVYNIDSAQTYDFWQRSEYGGTAGYFLHTTAFSINAGLKTAYWENDNLDKFSDTLEIGLVSEVLFGLSDKVQLKGNGSYNLAGAFGEKSVNASLFFRTTVADFSAAISYSDSYPRNYQRMFSGNLLNYSWTDKTLISTTKGEIIAKSKNKLIPLQLTAGFQNYRNLPFFLDNRWRQDTLTNLSFLNFSVRADFRLGKFFIQPSVRVQQSGFEYVPSLQAFARIGFNGYLFKAKKLHAAIGLEGGYCSSYRLLDFVPMADSYILPAASADGTFKTYTAMPKLHVFAQFELGFLRWFIRVENIEQTFIQSVNREAIGYPVVPLQIRLGLSWDLFN